MRLGGLFSWLLAEPVAAIQFARALNGSLIVMTSSGPVTGHAASNNSSVTEFLGIRYAQAPSGSLRFEPPKKFSGTSTSSGQNFGFTCPQGGSGLPQSTGGPPPNLLANGIDAAGLVLLQTVGGNTTPQSEDCLSLNIWIPSGGESSKAVMIFIHGGGLTSGSSNIPIYNGQIFASEQDVIVLTLRSYRLGIFGFPTNPTVPQKNLGLLDQRMAVEWIQTNIAAFGGDTNRMVLQGQSAGAASIDFYSFAYAADPIVQGFIQESGVMSLAGGGGGVQLPGGPPPGADQSNITAGWFNASAALGCGSSTSDPATVLSCMQTKNFTDIVTATTNIGFQPIPDGISVFSDYPARFAAGNFSKNPILLGSNNHETGMFEALSDATASIANPSPPPSVWMGIDNSAFVCPVAVRANTSAQLGVTTYRYRYFGVFPNTAISATSGAWHTSELLSIFGVVPSSSSVVPASTAAELAIMKYMRGAWAAFVKDPQKGLTAYGWPVYVPTAKTLVQLAINNMTGTNLGSAAMYDGVCGAAAISVNGSGSGGSSSGTFSSPRFSSEASRSSRWSLLCYEVFVLISASFVA
ncbi:alpha/beta-hydrolase [Stipitochalara longipes BDJ]|nr:alpha/beta-hydrolase [Stipitochalara longipes BDJ]